MSFFFFWKVQDLVHDDSGQRDLRPYTISVCARTCMDLVSVKGLFLILIPVKLFL